MMQDMPLSEFGKKYHLSDDQLVEIAKLKLGMDENDARLMLAIERGEVEGDAIEDVKNVL